ncbi:MAG: hypothetical protein IKX35_08030 [Bacteroidales bacterium]|nr:hypothetical protein [Bacteroidales bacterium]
MKKISIMIMAIVVALASCKKTPEVNLKYVDVERDLVMVGTTTANIQCDYEYIASLKKAYFCYGEGENEDNFTSAEMRVVQNTLYVELTGLRESTTYNYYYEFYNGFNSMRSALKSFKTEASPSGVTLPTVITAAVIEITTNSAKGGGEVTNDGGAEVTERGICWGTTANPTLDDSHVAAGSGTGVFTAAMSDLETNTTYHVRAYAINEKGTAYGLDREFVTISGGGDGNHEFVDLALPSGTLWASCNLGANSPEDYGDYFAWGETSLKDYYDWSTYKYCNGSDSTLLKYCTIADYGYEGFTDHLTVLLPEDDVATFFLGEDWQMPTDSEWEELINTTTSTWTTQNGVYGRLFTASNGNSIFLPAAGFRWVDLIGDVSSQGLYWSNYCFGSNPKLAGALNFRNDYCLVVASERSRGYTVRPVRKNNTPVPPSGVPEGAINGLFTINENGDQVYFSKGNLQYQASTDTWRFAENQWNYVGGVDYNQNMLEYGNVYENGVKCDNAMISSTYSGWIDLFGYGTSGYNHGAICYQPWSISYQWEAYYAYGSVNSNLNDQNGQADWGYNRISNGGNVEGCWRTLSHEEWNYLINVRSTISGIRFVDARVNDVNGIIVLPDNWDASLYELHNINNANVYNNGAYDFNVVTLEEWELLENNGAVFIPSSGGRTGDQYMSNGYHGYYWSTTSYDDHSSYSVCFSNSGVILCDYWISRTYGWSVRLVQDAH